MKNSFIYLIIIAIFGFIYYRIMRFKANMEKIFSKIENFNFVGFKENFKYLYFTFDCRLINPEEVEFKISDLVIYVYLSGKLIAVTGKTQQPYLITGKEYLIRDIGVKMVTENILELGNLDIENFSIKPLRLNKSIDVVKSFKINNIAVIQRETIII